jgi:hypothetical protein
MVRSLGWRLLFAGMLVLMLFAPASQSAQGQDDPTGREATIIDITSPVDGATVSGEVQIIGSAGHPTQFDRYELEFRNLRNTNIVWLPIGQVIRQQKTNEVLAIWDTVGNRVADGQYQIRLRVYLTIPDEPPVEFVVDNITVINTTPTELPTTRPDPPTPTVAPLPTEGPSPTPLIDQPSFNTPRPTLGAIVPSDDGGGTDDEGNRSLNLDSLSSAFCNGIFVALGFFAVVGAYLWLRTWLRPWTRQLMWQIRSELDNDERR